MSYTLPRRAAPPAGEHNLASYRWGPTVRASSYRRAPASHLPPVYLVDGVLAPDPHERWVSAVRDRKPWVEIAWREPRTVSRVRIERARRGTPPVTAAASYTLQCLPARREQPPRQIRRNSAATAIHLLNCRQARAVRIDWQLEASETARVYEIEVSGR